MEVTPRGYVGPRQSHYAVPLRSVKPDRDCPITKDEVLDLKIELYLHVETVEDLLHLSIFA